jgi:DUF1365 family protein
MTNEQINAAIAEACGWRKEDGVYMWTVNKIDCTYPELWDWCNDLNAMHEAEKVLAPKNWDRFSEKWWNYCKYLRRDDADKAIHATARQRAEAFLRTLGKWEEGE